MFVLWQRSPSHLHCGRGAPPTPLSQRSAGAPPTPTVAEEPLPLPLRQRSSSHPHCSRGAPPTPTVTEEPLPLPLWQRSPSHLHCGRGAPPTSIVAMVALYPVCTFISSAPLNGMMTACGSLASIHSLILDNLGGEREMDRSNIQPAD